MTTPILYKDLRTNAAGSLPSSHTLSRTITAIYHTDQGLALVYKLPFEEQKIVLITTTQPQQISKPHGSWDNASIFPTDVEIVEEDRLSLRDAFQVATLRVNPAATEQ